MAKVFIEETTLTAIGDAIREKEGTAELVPVNDMSARILAIQSGSDPIIESLEITSNGTYTATDCDGYSPITVNVPQDGAPPDEAFNYNGSVQQLFYSAKDHWSWFLNLYADRFVFNNITSMLSTFENCEAATKLPANINVVNIGNLQNCFKGCNNITTLPKIRGTIKWSTSTSFGGMLTSCHLLASADDLFEPDMLEGFNTVKVTSLYSCAVPAQFQNCCSLRTVPSWWYKQKLCPESTAFPTSTYSLYPSCFSSCFSLGEILNIPVWVCAAPVTSNLFNSTFSHCSSAKHITFETNDSSAIEAQWKAQIIDLTSYVGYANYRVNIVGYNSGIPEDKEVTDDATYQALKNDPDWFTCRIAYSRYNHDSAVETINSLPDTSAYLASAGGTNTIKFKGDSGSATDGGAINTLTAEEIAVAAAKGWTVTLV